MGFVCVFVKQPPKQMEIFLIDFGINIHEPDDAFKF